MSRTDNLKNNGLTGMDFTVPVIFLPFIKKKDEKEAALI